MVLADHPYVQGRSSDGIGRMHMKGASGCRQTVMHDPGARAQRPDQMFLTSSRFWRGRKTGVPGEEPSSQVAIDWNSAHLRSQRWEAQM